MTESDWKSFRKMIPNLRERYIARQNAELAQILESPDHSATDRFWNAHEKITEESVILKNCLDDLRRSRMRMIIHEMLNCGMMEISDLSEFSEELQERAKSWYGEKERSNPPNGSPAGC
jgi:hypothetical protein